MKARTALILYLAAVKASAKAGGRILWSSSQADYFYEGDGSPVSGRQLRATWDHYIVSAKEDIEKQTDRMLAQRISVNEYRQILRDHAKDMARLGYMTGRGGHAQMTPADWLAVAREVKRQNHFVDRFADQLQAGSAGTEGQIRVRAGLYGQAGYGMIEAGQRSAKDRAGYTHERRNAVMDQNTCGRCAELAGRGWQPLGSLPLPGKDTPCGSNCRCEMEYKGNPPMTTAEADYLTNKVMEEYSHEGDTGFSYSVLQHDEPAEGYALSIYPERERQIPMDKLHFEDIQQYAEDNADLLLDDSKFKHIVGGWAHGGQLYLDVSVIVPSDQQRRAAKLTLEYNQLAMWSLHDQRAYTDDECKEILEDGKESERAGIFHRPDDPGGEAP